MLLQRFTERARQLAALAAFVVAAGCASPGPKSVGSEAAAGVTAEGEAVVVEIPPQARTLFEQAVAVMAAGDFVDAELRFEEFLLLYPAYPGAHVNLAIVHVQNGDDQAAGASLDAALALDPDYAPALNQQGMLLRRNGKFLEAEATYLKAVTASPDYALAHYNLGVLYELYLQRLDAALHHFEVYQDLEGGDKQVEKWIADLRRRVAANQRTANVAE
jgi:tetratricopeptide (TPR) repeat protein